MNKAEYDQRYVFSLTGVHIIDDQPGGGGGFKKACFPNVDNQL